MCIYMRTYICTYICVCIYIYICRKKSRNRRGGRYGRNDDLLSGFGGAPSKGGQGNGTDDDIIAEEDDGSTHRMRRHVVSGTGNE